MNRLKEAFANARATIGLWQALATPYTAEICAGCGYDWLLFDGEHAPNTLQTLLAQLQAIAAFPIEPIARPPIGEPAVIKQYLDIGFRSLLIPMVKSADQAEQIVASTRFPPAGIRGVASATSRASGFGANSNYLRTAQDDICLLMQIETTVGLRAIEEIAAVPGVDGLFIGPADLAASLGHLGDPRHPEVQAEIDGALIRIQVTGKPAGIFALDLDDARARLAAGAMFVSTGTDIGLLSRAARQLAQATRVVAGASESRTVTQ